MDTKNYYLHSDGNKNELRNWSAEKLAADPSGGGLYAGRQWFNTTTSTFKYYDGVAIQTVATMAELTKIGTFQGTHDASGGLLPSTTFDGSAVAAGDYWRVSVAGTIVGIGGSDVLEIGDLIFANVDAAAVAANFTAVQANLNLSSNIALVEEVTLASLAASTPTAIPTTFTNAYNIQAFNSSNEEIGLAISGAPTAPIAQSNVALTNVKFRITGN